MQMTMADTARIERNKRIGTLLAIALVSMLLWQTTIGSLLLFPFTILATWFHEMGHGLVAMLTGSRFDHLVVNADGSGYAQIAGVVDRSRILDAMTSARGPFGPAIAGCLLILSSTNANRSRRALKVLGVSLILSTVVWIRSAVGWLVLPGMGLAMIAYASWAGQHHLRFAVQLLGVQACISVWSQFDYLFSDGGYVGGEAVRSDTSAIADALLLPYWFWGGAISVVIVAMLGWSFHRAFRIR